MKKLTMCLLFLLFCSCSYGSGTQEPQAPLGQSELLGLVAGAALPENLVTEIRGRGLTFHVDAFFRTEMEKAGADPMILAALDTAKTIAAEGAKETTNKDLLEHIANAGKFIKSEKYSEAADELNAVVRARYQSPESGFVMGQILRLQDRWDEAAAV